MVSNDRRAIRIGALALSGRVALATALVFAGAVPLVGHISGGGWVACWAVIVIGAVTLARTLFVVARVDDGRLLVRNTVRTYRFDPTDIASISASTTSVAGGRQVRAGVLVVTDQLGKHFVLLATSAAPPERIVPFTEALRAIAPAAALDIDLKLFPHLRSKHAGSGRYGPVPPVAQNPGEALEDSRLRRQVVHADLGELRSELQKIKAAKRP